MLCTSNMNGFIRTSNVICTYLLFAYNSKLTLLFLYIFNHSYVSVRTILSEIIISARFVFFS